MPWSRITSATAEISASVFFARSRVSTESSVRSGTMPEKIFTCFTWPAITACLTPAAFSSLMHLPRCPSDTQCSAVSGARAAAAVKVGHGFFLRPR